jgi:methylated-DNA-protein-cysteine methyltransferase-like protein
MAESASSDFANKVYEIVILIPYGKVMTYGQIAALAGNPKASRIVGGVAHFGPPDLPWHRVVKKDGFLANGFPGGGRDLQKKLLEDEGIKFNEDYQIIDFKDRLNLI